MYFQQFPANQPTASVTQNDQGVLISLINGILASKQNKKKFFFYPLVITSGISVLVEMETVNVSSSQYSSWLTLTINTVRNIRNYSHQLEGLMGNFNGIPTDDVTSRNGLMPTNLSLESSIYPIANTCEFAQRIFYRY
jgi:hypothetical protein